ncbi:MAG: hypothetical protein JST89_26865, partial [Cyanobacteria bacterium SZAS-4]|nr:hypothetical protein [Cyanobacteria bacterium SZAS-4]
AIKALRIATTQQLTFDEALASLGEEHKKTQNLPSASNEITDLLLEAGVISNEQIGRALATSLETKMQMGRVLVFHREVTSQMMRAAIICALMIQEERIDMMSAIQALQAVKRTNMTIEQVLFKLDLYVEEPGQGPKLYELFAMAGFVSESDLLECLEIHVLRGRQIGQIFIEQGLITHDVLENAITLQGMIASNSIKAFHAAEALKNAHARQISIYHALGELDPPALPLVPSLSFGRLLVDAGVVCAEKLCEMQAGMELNALQVAKKMLAGGYLNDKTCVLALRAYSLNAEGFVSNKAMAEILRQCLTYNLSLTEELAKRGHFVPNRMQWIWR